MFDERRQRVIGIDKSYPLQPITTRPMPNAASRPVKATTVMKIFHVPADVAVRMFIVQSAMREHMQQPTRRIFFFNCVWPFPLHAIGIRSIFHLSIFISFQIRFEKQNN